MGEMCTSRAHRTLEWLADSRPAWALRRFVSDEDGPTATEYAILLGLLVLVAMASITAMGSSMEDIYVRINGAVVATGL